VGIDEFHSIFSLWQLEGKGHVMWTLTNQQAAWWCNALQFLW